MHDPVVLLYLRNDPVNTLRQRISDLLQQGKLSSLDGRDDAIQLSADAVLLDRTSAHGIFSQLCASLAAQDHPYLVLPIGEHALASGKFSEAISKTLKKYQFAFSVP